MMNTSFRFPPFMTYDTSFSSEKVKIINYSQLSVISTYQLVKGPNRKFLCLKFLLLLLYFFLRSFYDLIPFINPHDERSGIQIILIPPHLRSTDSRGGIGYVSSLNSQNILLVGV